MDQERKPKLITKNFVLVFIIDVLFASCFSLLNVVIPLWLSESFHADSGDIGVVLGLSLASTIVFRPFMGYAVDHWGRKKILFSAILLFGALNFCYLFVQNMWVVMLIRFVQCIPFAAYTISIVTLATDTIPSDRRGEGYSIFTAASTIPLAIGSASALALYEINWYLPFIAAGSVGLFCLVISLLIKFPKYEPKKSKLSFNNLLNKKVALITVIGAISCSIIPGFLSYLSLYAKEISLNLNYLGIIITCYAVTVFIVRMFGARILNKTNPKITGSIAISFMCIGALIIGTWKSLIGIIVGAIITGFGAGIIFPTMLMMAGKISTENRGISNSMVYAGLDIAQSLGAFMFGTIAKIIGTYGSTYVIFSGYEAIGLLIFLLFTIPQFERDVQSVVN